jgi:hypothetical protein
MIHTTQRLLDITMALMALSCLTAATVSSFQVRLSTPMTITSTTRRSSAEIRLQGIRIPSISAPFSDIPRDEELIDPPISKTKESLGVNQNKNNDGGSSNQSPVSSIYNADQEKQREKSWWGRLVPPPPEDQFIMTGDICVLFFYAFTSHSLNDFIVNSMLQRNDMTVLQVVHSLDPLGEVVNTQIPSWVQTQNQLAVDHVLSVNAQETLLNHWGPLFSTEGSACVALCTCWLIAGWLHRAFLFQNSVHCSTEQALSKTLETWVSTCVMMVALAMAANSIVEHIPALQTLLCVQCAVAKAVAHGAMGMDGTVDAASGEMLLGTSAATTSSVLAALTKADIMFIVDSMSVLIAWRFMANKMLNIFR